MLRRVYPIGVITLEGNTLRLQNRTYVTSVVLDDEHTERWRKKLMAYGGRGTQQQKGTSLRLTGLFAAKARRGLFVGSMRAEDMPALVEKIKEAKTAGRTLSFFVWKNDRGGPALSLSVDVERDYQKSGSTRGGSARRRPIEPDDDILSDTPDGDEDIFGKD